MLLMDEAGLGVNIVRNRVNYVWFIVYCLSFIVYRLYLS